jgi:hypothetical protein
MDVIHFLLCEYGPEYLFWTFHQVHPSCASFCLWAPYWYSPVFGSSYSWVPLHHEISDMSCSSVFCFSSDHFPFQFSFSLWFADESLKLVTNLRWQRERWPRSEFGKSVKSFRESHTRPGNSTAQPPHVPHSRLDIEVIVDHAAEFEARMGSMWRLCHRTKCDRRLDENMVADNIQFAN